MVQRIVLPPRVTTFRVVCSAGAADHVCTWFQNGALASPHQYYRDTPAYRYVLSLGFGPGEVVGFTYCDCCTYAGPPDPCSCLTK